MNLFLRLFTALNAHSVQYLVVGGIAVNLYGIERATADIDVAILLEKENIDRFIEAAIDLGLKPRVPVRLEDLADKEARASWIGEKNMTVFSLTDPANPFFLLDVFVDVPFDFRAVYARSLVLSYGDVPIRVAAIDDLIAMKKATARPQDLADAFYLRKLLEKADDER